MAQKPGLRQWLTAASRSQLLMAAALAALFLWFPLMSLKDPVVDPDIWWHMRTGEWIVQHHQVPRTDPFSITGAGRPWVAYSWTFELLAYWVGKYWDLLGLAALRIGMWLAATWAFYRLMRANVAGFWTAAGLTALGSYVMVRAFAVRPGSLTILFFVLELSLLWDAGRTGRSGRLWLLPALLCLWANVHAQFVYGLFVLGLFCIEPALNRIARYRSQVVGGARVANRTLWIILAASAAATLVNPYGWRVYQVVFEYGHQVWSKRYILEMSPLPFDQFSDYLAVLLVLGAAFALGRARQVRPLWVVLLGWAALFAFRSQRDIWLLAIVCTLLIATESSPALSARAGEELHSRAKLWAVAAIIATLATAWQYITPTNKDLLSYLALRLPLGSVAYIHEHHLRGPLFNNFDWGGFLIYALPDEKVAIDGRTNVHGAAEMERSFNTWNGGPGWQSDPLLQEANLVIAGPAFALTQLLRADPHWRPVFEDGVSTIFLRVDR